MHGGIVGALAPKASHIKWFESLYYCRAKRAYTYRVLQMRDYYIYYNYSRQAITHSYHHVIILITEKHIIVFVLHIYV